VVCSPVLSFWSITLPIMRPCVSAHSRVYILPHGRESPTRCVTFLLASATAAIFGCRRWSRLVNHPLVLSTLFFAARIAERAPWISSVRKYTLPRFTHPQQRLACRRWSFAVAPGPARAETCRPLSKLRASAIDATSALAASGPMPGIFSRLAAELAATVPGGYLLLELLHSPIQLLQMLGQAIDQVPKRRGEFIAGILEDLGYALGDIE